MNTGLLVSTVTGGLVVLIAEYLRRRHKLNNEIARKLIHSAHALTVGTWPFFTNYSFIIGAEILFVVLVLAARKLGWLQALREVERATWGEVFLGLGVIATALLKPVPLVFLAAMFHIGIADCIAALFGKRLKSKAYAPFGYQKTVIGSVAFVLGSMGIIAGLAVFSTMAFSTSTYITTLLLLPLITVVVENVSVYGADNLTVPIAVVIFFSALGF